MPQPSIADISMLPFFRPKDKAKTARAVEQTRNAWFGQVASLIRGSHLDESLWEELEYVLYSADMGIATVQVLLNRLRQRARDEGTSNADDVLKMLKDEIVTILSPSGTDKDLTQEHPHTPLVILMVGVNGVGKTTSIAKLTRLYQDQEEGVKIILGAADTFRAGAIEQLQYWGNRLDVDVIAHRPEADPAAVSFDTLQAAKARGADVVIIDSAGRLHTKLNLMEEIKKVQRVLNQVDKSLHHQVLLTLDATTGQNGIYQARAFVDALSCDGVFLSKLDGTAKGGMVVSIANDLKLPVLYIGTGEEPGDIAVFDPTEFVEALFRES